MKWFRVHRRPGGEVEGDQLRPRASAESRSTAMICADWMRSRHSILVL
jgi:hypothetical protein